jgi:chromosome segregation ATPase
LTKGPQVIEPQDWDKRSEELTCKKTVPDEPLLQTHTQFQGAEMPIEEQERDRDDLDEPPRQTRTRFQGAETPIKEQERDHGDLDEPPQQTQTRLQDAETPIKEQERDHGDLDEPPQQTQTRLQDAETPIAKQKLDQDDEGRKLGSQEGKKSCDELTQRSSVLDEQLSQTQSRLQDAEMLVEKQKLYHDDELPKLESQLTLSQDWKKSCDQLTQSNSVLDEQLRRTQSRLQDAETLIEKQKLDPDDQLRKLESQEWKKKCDGLTQRSSVLDEQLRQTQSRLQNAETQIEKQKLHHDDQVRKLELQLTRSHEWKKSCEEMTPRSSVLDKQLRRSQTQLQAVETSMIKQERDHDDERRKLESQLRHSQELYAELRRVVRVFDLDESKDLVDEFKELNSQIRDVCFGITSSIIDHFDPKGAKTSLIANGKLGAEFAPESLVNSKIKADIFITTLLRFHVSTILHSSFVKFHPLVTLDLMGQYYQSIRRTG